MAVIYRCDKCDKEYDEGHKYNLKDILINPDTTPISQLCENCVKRLFQWLQPDPKVAAKQ